jgi:dTDP-L-rhamnose 4-epimerase
MRILVTGGAGFIGSYVVEALLEKGHYVVALDNLDPQVHGPDQRWPDYLTSDAERRQGDVRDRRAVSQALDGCDGVVHLAAAVGVGQSMYEIARYSEVNVMGTAVLLEEIVKRRDRIRKLVVAASMSSYGEGAYRAPDGRVVYPTSRPSEQLQLGDWEMRGPSGELLSPIPTPEEKPLRPESVYAINKRDQEEMCLCVGAAYGIPVVALRMFNVFGARQALSNPYTGVVAIFASRLLNGQPPLVYEDGHQRRDFVHVTDVARAYALALESDRIQGVSLNLGSGRSVSVLEIARTLAHVLSVDLEPQVTGKYRLGDIRHCFAEIGLIRNTLSWEPRYELTTGLETMVQWLQGESVIDKVVQAQAELLARGLLK